jgi:hypothetical protein
VAVVRRKIIFNLRENTWTYGSYSNIGVGKKPICAKVQLHSQLECRYRTVLVKFEQIAKRMRNRLSVY